MSNQLEIMPTRQLTQASSPNFGSIAPFNSVENIDCLEYMATMKDNSIDCIISDPPYFLPIQSYVGTRNKGYSKRTLADTSILRGYFERVFAELDRIIKPDGTYYIFCDGQSYPIFYQVMFPYCKYVRPLIWDKMISYNGYTWRHQHEIIAWGEKDESKRIPTGDGDIIKCRGVLQKDRFHDAEKPVELLEKLISKHPHYKTYLDPYAGSGSLGVACAMRKRSFIGCELDENNAKVANDRIQEALKWVQ